MPQLLMHIDQIARQKQRDVLPVEFHDLESGFKLNYTLNPARKAIVEWLVANNIPHYECGCYASETRFESYGGQIYIDVPFDKNDPMYRKVESFLENPDGSMKFDGAWFRGYRLEYCMKNAHHDVPGFWEQLAQEF